MIVRRIRPLGDDVGSGVLLPPDQGGDLLDQIAGTVPPPAPAGSDSGSPTNPYASDDAAQKAAAEATADTIADQAIASMRSAYSQLVSGTVGWLSGVVQSAAQAQTAKQIRDLGPRLSDWYSRKAWARQGVSSSGVPYGWDTWASEGAIWQDAMRSYAENYAQGSAIGAALDSVSADFDDLKRIEKKISDAAGALAGALDNAWVWWLVGAGAVGIVGLGLYRRAAGP